MNKDLDTLNCNQLEDVYSFNGEKKSNFNFGEWVTNTFGNTPSSTQNVTNNPAINEALMQSYNKSGSKMTFNEWVNSEKGKGILNELSKLLNVAINKPNSGLPIGTVPTGTLPKGDEPLKAETKILGMSPVTFGIVSVGIIAVSAVVAVVIMRNKKGKLLPTK